MARFVIIFFLLTKENVWMLKEVEVQLQNGGLPIYGSLTQTN
jgi:hypothetical protein